MANIFANMIRFFRLLLQRFRHASETTYASAPLNSLSFRLIISLAIRKAQESQPLDAETIAKRTKRHLDELEVCSFPYGSLPIHYLIKAGLRVAL